MISLAILGSGSGSNMQAILDAIRAGSLDARISIVLSDNPDAYILERARANAIPAGIIDCSPHRMKFPLQAQHEAALRIRAAGADLLCLAGFMRLVKRPLLDAFPSRILNIHPSLLPAFPGLEAWRQAIEMGVSESGVTVHIVDSGVDTGPILGQARVPVLPGDTPETLHAGIDDVDTGPILGQARVPVLPGDTPETLHARIQAEEHRLYPETIAAYARKLSL